MFCVKCGYEIKGEARFCPKCGKDLSDFLDVSEPQVGSIQDAQMELIEESKTEVMQEPKIEPKVEQIQEPIKEEIVESSLSAPVEKVEENDDGAVKEVELKSSTKKTYDIVVFDCGSKKIELMKLVRKNLKVNLREAKTIVENPPFTVVKGVKYDQAKKMLEILNRYSITAEITKEGESINALANCIQSSSQSLKRANTACVANGIKDKSSNQNEDCFDSKPNVKANKPRNTRGLFLSGSIIKLVASVLSLTAICFWLFMPFFEIVKEVEVNGVMQEEPSSISFAIYFFNIITSFIKLLIENNFQFSLGTLYALIYVPIAMLAISLCVVSVISVITNVKNLIKFEDMYKNRSDLDAVIDKNKKKQTRSVWISFISLMVLFYFMGMLKNVIKSTVVTSLVLVVASVAIEAIGSILKNKASK